MSKSRLAPSKVGSIPRLEPLGALIRLRLTRQVCSAFKVPTKWSNLLGGQSHRVGEIHKFSAPNQWCYVPMDVGRRGLTVEELASADLWWNRPKLLKKSKQEWPECKFDKPTSTENLELKGAKGCYQLPNN